MFRKTFSYLILSILISFPIIAEPIVITILDCQDTSDKNSVQDTINIWDKFEKEHPEIIIKRETYSDEGFDERLNYYIENNCLPDIFYCSPNPDSYSKTIQDEHLAKDLYPLLEKDGLLDDYEDIYLDTSNYYGGYMNVIPNGINSSAVLYCNTKLLKKYGFEKATTYEELKEQCNYFNNKFKDKQGLIFSGSDSNNIVASIFSLLIGRFGGNNYALDINNSEQGIKEGPFKEALSFIDTMFKDGIIREENFDRDFFDFVLDFIDGKAPYALGNVVFGSLLNSAIYDADEDSKIYDSLKEIEEYIDVIPFPTIPGEKYPGSIPGYFYEGYAINDKIPAGSKKEETCFTIIKYLAGSDVQQYRLDDINLYPTLKYGVSYESLSSLEVQLSDYLNNILLITPPVRYNFTSNFIQTLGVGLQCLYNNYIDKDSLLDILSQTIENGYTYEEVESSLYNGHEQKDEEIVEETDDNLDNSFEIIKEIKSEHGDFTYTIRKENKGYYSIYIEDSLQEDFIMILFSRVEDALNMVYAIEHDISRLVINDFIASLSFDDAPVKGLIEMLMDESIKAEKTWKQFSDTNEFYYEVDTR